MLPDIYVYAPDLSVADGTVTPAKLASSVYGLVGEIGALGTVSAGSSVRLARADHVHPTTGLALLGSANAFTVGGHTITSAAAATVPLKITAHATQSADMFQLVTSAGANLAKVSSAGKLTTIIDGGSA